MSSSTPSHKFLLDENVRIELYRFLINRRLDVKLAPKSASDNRLAQISNQEKRILVTNDRDFVEYSKDEVFSIILLRIAQNDYQALTSSFEKMLLEIKDYSGKLITLKESSWDEFPLSQDLNAVSR